MRGDRKLIWGMRGLFLHDNEENDDLVEPLRPASGSHIRTRAHFHRNRSDWVFVDDPEFDPAAATPPESLDLWVVYRSPLDYPDKYVVRHWIVTGSDDIWVDDPPLAVTDTLDAARKAIQPVRRVNIGRFEAKDDPSVFEAWM